MSDEFACLSCVCVQHFRGKPGEPAVVLLGEGLGPAGGPAGKFGFGYDYMGLNVCLVITSLMDRVYLTITQALYMHLGSGTGKTETVKDLAKAMELLCVVTNCGEGMD